MSEQPLAIRVLADREQDLPDRPFNPFLIDPSVSQAVTHVTIATAMDPTPAASRIDPLIATPGFLTVTDTVRGLESRRSPSLSPPRLPRSNRTGDPRRLPYHLEDGA